MTTHNCLGYPCKICFPDLIDPMLTSQKPYIPYIKLDEDNAKVAETNKQEGLERLANALAMAWEQNSKLRDEINALKDRINLLEQYAPSDVESFMPTYASLITDLAETEQELEVEIDLNKLNKVYKERLDLLEGGLRSLRLYCEAHGLEATASNLKRYGLWVDVSDVGRYQ